RPAGRRPRASREDPPMSCRRVAALLTVLALGLAALPLSAQTPPDLNDLHEKAMKAAAEKEAPSVVQITATGGADIIQMDAKGGTLRKAMGPTTGVVVAEDGYIVSSAFNFANNPTTILVSVPGQEKPHVATRVATDRARMLTLLRIDAK